MKVIVGTLRTGEVAEMRFVPTVSENRVMWHQRAVTKSAAHLNRDYVCNEGFHDIVKTWLPCDWKTFRVLEEPEEPEEERVMWGDQ